MGGFVTSGPCGRARARTPVLAGLATSWVTNQLQAGLGRLGSDREAQWR